MERKGEMPRQCEMVTSKPAVVSVSWIRSTSRSRPTPLVRAMMLMDRGVVTQNRIVDCDLFGNVEFRCVGIFYYGQSKQNMCG